MKTKIFFPAKAILAALLPFFCFVVVLAQQSGEVPISGGSYAFDGTGDTLSSVFRVNSGVTARITLTNVKRKSNSEKSALIIEPEAVVTLILNGDNYFEGGLGFAGVEVHETARLTITGTGSIKAVGKGGGAGIGGSSSVNNAGAITFDENFTGTVTAEASAFGAAIGGGNNGNGGVIKIHSGTVNAKADSAAAIGGGNKSEITIVDGTVNVETSNATAIDGGSNGFVFIDGDIINAKSGAALIGAKDIDIKDGTLILNNTATTGEKAAIIENNGQINISGNTTIITNGFIGSGNTSGGVPPVKISEFPIVFASDIKVYNHRRDGILLGDHLDLDDTPGNKKITLRANFTVPQNTLFTIPPEWTLHIEDNVTFINNGTIISLGKIAPPRNIIHTVLFEENGYGPEIDSLTNIVSGSTLGIFENKLKYSNVDVVYPFLGWYKDRPWLPWRFASDRVTDDITIYAQWEFPLNINISTGSNPECSINAAYIYGENDTTHFDSKIITGSGGKLVVTVHSNEANKYRYTWTGTGIPEGVELNGASLVIDHVFNPVDVVCDVRKKSNDVSLQEMTADGRLVFSADGLNYTILAEPSASEITITATANDPEASVSGEGTYPLKLTENNEFIITVTAEDGTIKDYTVVVLHEIMQGKCYLEDDNHIDRYLTWIFEDGDLIINGNGAMENYDQNNVPWQPLFNFIKRIVIGENVTGIGSWAFYGCIGLTTVTNLHPSGQNINDKNVFGSLILDSITLFVQSGTTAEYKKADVWKKFNISVAVTDVHINQATVNLPLGHTVRLVANVLPVDATNRKVTWQSNNEAVAVVSDNGTVTAVSIGKATITAKTAEGAFTNSCEVNVIDNTAIRSVDAQSTQVYFSGKKLYVNSPVSERISVYSVTGALLYEFDKAAGVSTTATDGSTPRVLIVRGTSGWAKKLIIEH
ncbi:MAG: Ig-like domain-containing protein [Dysgonamonadaceae bacterium]|nr:Ig-like domain-containing protein [Dysgonamonadaceae bacterium]